MKEGFAAEFFPASAAAASRGAFNLEATGDAFALRLRVCQKTATRPEPAFTDGAAKPEGGE